MPDAFEVVPYRTIQDLTQILAERSDASLQLVSRKLHLDYFEEYLGELGVKAIVVEKEYVDRDYLEDFAAYYIRCHHNYGHRCSRLHLFSIDFDDADLLQLLSGAPGKLDGDVLQSSYCGFVVVKPLPETVIGRTCLKTYEPDGGHRHYPITREYEANLYGIPLKVRSLAFQEQDTVAAACATSALWSAFHATGKSFQHPILSPVEITKAAGATRASATRMLPNEGLRYAEIAEAIRNVGLEPFLIDVPDHALLKATLYGYLSGKVPVLLGVSLWDTSRTPAKFEGLHAVVATGFSLGRAKPSPNAPTGLLLESSRIDQLYVHDDQVGPFARMVFDRRVVKASVGGKPVSYQSLRTSWRGADGKSGSMRAVEDGLLIPLYHKIRIPYEVLHATIRLFDIFIEILRTNGMMPIRGRLKWDLRLTKVNELKMEVMATRAVSNDLKREVMADQMPRFIWRATALYAGLPIIDLLFDATDIEQGRNFHRAIEYDLPVASVLRKTARSRPIREVLPSLFQSMGLGELMQRRHALVQFTNILEWFEKQPDV